MKAEFSLLTTVLTSNFVHYRCTVPLKGMLVIAKLK
uniref:Uncharacterized protein n=1 Tax=Anguilla anguilla TaxID=7936 RepID=A0A0E9V0F3_ANGAN